MVRRPSLIVALLATGSAVPLAAQDLQVPDLVRLPGEYTIKEEPGARIVDLKRVSECVTDDPGLHSRAVDLVQLESAVKSQSAEIDALGDTLKESDAALRIERAAFDELVTGLRKTDKALNQLSLSVKRLGTDHSTQDKVDRYNEAVELYNSDVRKRNLQLAEVKRAQAEYRTKLDAHNAKVHEQHRRIDEYDARRATFRTTGETFIQDVRNFDSDCLRPSEQ
jgi:hypothetical protein